MSNSRHWLPPFSAPFSRAVRRVALNLTDATLVFPELLEKTALLEFLKYGQIDETLRRHVLRPGVSFRHFVQDKFYPLDGGRRDFLQSLRVEGKGIVQNLFVVHPQILF